MSRSGTFVPLIVGATLAACRGRAPVAPERKPTIEEAIAAAKVAPIPLHPVVPARRTNVVVAPKPTRVENAALVAVGKEIFFDESLSEPAGTSCASCHDPKTAFSGAHGSMIGVPLGSRPGHFARRTAPSVLYLRYVPKFHTFEDDEAAEPAPFGGFFWDGRADSLAALVRQPLFNPDEMNAGDPRRVAAKVARAPWRDELRATTGDARSPEAILNALGAALEAYLTSDEMTPATSKFDAWVRGEATLTPQEQRGLEVFKDGARGGCAGCHRLNEASTNPQSTMFTDYGFDAIAVPRNRALPRNHDASAYDLGLCERKDTRTPSSDGKWCGSFRTPSLRNVAVRATFMHNAAFTKLRDVVAFYANRASSPGRFYAPGQRFDDLPEKYRDNVNVSSNPYNRAEGGPPAMTDEDIDAIVAFLGTLTDAAYRPGPS
ncbi:MAG TPA: cytochrome c peroxidase [Polyangia bacterium]|nr:cytochrome c peroxidase [Polyangia bacterium]